MREMLEEEGVGGVLDQLAGRRRTILFVTLPGAISSNLVHALEREFPWLIVEQVDQVRLACAPYLHPVSLILIDARMLGEMEAATAEISRIHPYAHAAVIEFNERAPVCSLSELLRSSLVRGVLPMNVKLDVWLSVIQLMLRGGEYFPIGLVHSHRTAEDVSERSGELLAASMMAAGNVPSFPELTRREGQIVEMVARGLQNKIIANQFNLSENTVKIHIHNIITKLGVRNRTEAAARFRERAIAAVRR